MIKNTILATTALFMAAPVIIVTNSFAQSDLATVDTDGSGAVSFAEATAVISGLTEDMFAAADLDQDGELSAEEYDALLVTISQ